MTDRDEESITPAPRWVRVFGVVAILLVLAFVVRHLVGGGFGRDMH